MKFFHYLFLLCFLLLAACNPGQVNSVSQGDTILTDEAPLSIESKQPAELEMQAQAALTDYFKFLDQGMYDRAVELYGGSYEELLYFNPMIDPDNGPDLFKAACEINGFVCLPILSSILVDVEGQLDFAFDVAFSNPDGSLFVLGPCCGATEEIMPPMSVFRIHVRCDDEGLCQVLDLPPYVP